MCLFCCVRYNENNALGTWQRLSCGLADNLTGTPNISVGTLTTNEDSNIKSSLTINTNKATTGTTTIGLKVHCGNQIDGGGAAPGAPFLIGLGTEPAAWAKCAIGHVRTSTYDQGDIVFLNRNSNDAIICDITNERMQIRSESDRQMAM